MWFERLEEVLTLTAGALEGPRRRGRGRLLLFMTIASAVALGMLLISQVGTTPGSGQVEQQPWRVQLVRGYPHEPEHGKPPPMYIFKEFLTPLQPVPAAHDAISAYHQGREVINGLMRARKKALVRGGDCLLVWAPKPRKGYDFWWINPTGKGELIFSTNGTRLPP